MYDPTMYTVANSIIVDRLTEAQRVRQRTENRSLSPSRIAHPTRLRIQAARLLVTLALRLTPSSTDFRVS